MTPIDKPKMFVLQSANLLGIAGDQWAESRVSLGRQSMSHCIDSSEQPAQRHEHPPGPVARKSHRAISLALLPGLHPIARADVLGRVEQNRVRLLTSQRSKPFSGTCRNRQTGNDATSPRYGSLEEEADHTGAVVVNTIAEKQGGFLLGLSHGRTECLN